MAVCPACGEQNEERFRLCGFCGHALEAAETAQVRKTVTIVFSDICDSTSLGERLDPESLRTLMARYFEAARTVIERHGGTVEKFIGDAVMAVFGVPVAHEDDALRAIRAAVEIGDVLKSLDRESAQTWGVRLQARTGINSGEVIAGDPSSGQAFVSGDAVNVAARLEQAAAPGQIIISADTLRLVRDAVRVEPKERLSLKGKTQPVAAFRLLSVVPGASPFTRRLDMPMIGRDDELRELLAVFDRSVQARRCELVSILGAAGVGKSRLAGELLSRLAQRTRVLVGRCLPYGEGITFWPVSEMVKQAAAIDDRDSPAEARAKISSLLPGDDEATMITDRVAAAIGLGDTRAVLQETFWAFRRLLESLATDDPVVAFFDDIHWAEPALLDLIEYVTSFSTGHPLFLLCTARPEVHEQRPDWGRYGTTVAVGPLDAENGARLVERMTGETHMPSEIRDRVLAAADGNPLFIEEMLHMLIDEGAMQQQDGQWVVAGSASGLPAPKTIQAIVSARLDRLHDEERAVIQRAAVVGRVFYWGAIDELSAPGARAGVGAHLQTLLRKELIQPEPSAFAGEDAFRFSHILIRDAAYDSIPKRTTAQLHESFAAWLERVSGARIREQEEIIGYHLEQAAHDRQQLGLNDDRTRELSRRAAERLGAAGVRAIQHGDGVASGRLLERCRVLWQYSKSGATPDLAR